MKRLGFLFCLFFMGVFLFGLGASESDKETFPAISFVRNNINGDAIEGNPVRKIITDARSKDVIPNYIDAIDEVNKTKISQWLQTNSYSEMHALFQMYLIQVYILQFFFKEDELTSWAKYALWEGAERARRMGKRGGNAWLY